METTTRLGFFAAWVILHLVAFAAGESLPLPSILKPCSRNDPKLMQCATANAIAAVPKLKNGLPDYGVPPLDPLYIKRIQIDKKLLDLDLQMDDVLFHGITQSKVKSVRIELNPPTFSWTLLAPKTVFLGKYEVDGKLLLLPISGKGNINITLIDAEFTCLTNFGMVKKEDGEEYLVPESSSIQHKLKRIYFHLENLFNGNKVLGDTMNSFLNENWKEVDGYLGKVFAAEVAAAIKSIVDGVTKRVAFSQLLPEDI